MAAFPPFFSILQPAFGNNKSVRATCCSQHGYQTPRSEPRGCHEPCEPCARMRRWASIWALPAAASGSGATGMCSSCRALPHLWEFLNMDPPCREHTSHFRGRSENSSESFWRNLGLRSQLTQQQAGRRKKTICTVLCAANHFA